ncbi:hypothetical protein [Azospirillum rugosum]|uniref:DUF2029 domain-containing protein n=2 Tax=Azospirillum rugosum TaxID=416170 RepID=A0ABS4SKY7_9PROT|nr:hypothetical protein [Azospirillum rugosum]MBP2293142.1 hypothetical protein [Azospirillum rugosum]MDQ0526691.1 hypothetical protein [Azospirillum rugosum]
MPLPPFAPPSSGRRARRASAAFLLLAPLLYGLLGLALGMDANWDLRNYHWYNAYALLTGRLGQDMLPAQMPSFYNPLLDVPFFLLANHLPAPVAGFVWSALQGLNLSLLFLIARATLRIGTEGQRVAIAAGLAVMGGLGGGTLGLLGTTFHDNMVSLGVLGALAVVLCGLPRLIGGRARGAFLRVGAAGLMAGAAMGLKNPSVIYAVGLCLAFLVLPTRPWRWLWLSFFFGVGVLGGLALFGGFWMAHLWHDYGNPVFPHMNHIFKSPFAAISDYVNVGFFPASTLERILFPFFFTFAPLKVGEVAFLDLRILVLFVLVPVAAALALLGKGSRLQHGPATLADRAATRYLLTAMAVMYALWVVMFCIYRYLVPLEILAPLAIVMAAGLLPVPRRGAVVVAAVLLLLVQATVRPADWGRVAWSDRWVEAEVPPIEDPDHTMVLMGGYWAISHVIPAFPPRIPFVRIQSNFLQPDSVGNGYLALLKDKVGAHHGRFLMLSTIPDTAGAAEAALLLGLRVDQGACRVIPNNLGEPLNLCSVERVPVD